MEYLLLFLEGIITFISPCLLPMLPIYISYFAGSATNNHEFASSKNSALKNSIAFVLGFGIIFTMLGAFAGTIGSLLIKYSSQINIAAGLIIILFGLNFMGVLNIPFLNKTKKFDIEVKQTGFFSTMLFGIIFAIGWTPCVGAFLGSALMIAAQSGNVFKGIVMLLCFSLGLGIPFIISAILIDKLKSTFDFIKKNYKVINIISGLLLIIVGILMATGMMGYFLSLLTF